MVVVAVSFLPQHTPYTFPTCMQARKRVLAALGTPSGSLWHSNWQGWTL